jgi:hypothetical protein
LTRLEASAVCNLRTLAVATRVAAIVLAVVAGGCEKKIDAGKAEELVKSLFTARGVAGVEVSCPTDIKPKKDDVFTCRGKPEGVSFEAEVTEKDDVGNVVARLKGIVFPGELKQGLEQKAKAQVPEATVDCGPEKVRVAHVGDHIKCTAHTPSGEVPISAVVKDEYGLVALEEPAAAPEPPASADHGHEEQAPEPGHEEPSH